MKVIVNLSGFYGGDWKDAGPKEVEMNDKVAKQFLPPRGHQLSLPASRRASPPTPSPVKKKDD